MENSVKKCISYLFKHFIIPWWLFSIAIFISLEGFKLFHDQNGLGKFIGFIIIILGIALTLIIEFSRRKLKQKYETK